MSYSLLQSDKAFIFENLFLGISEPDNDLNRLFAHRFEATFLTRVLGKLASAEQIRYELIFREFLKYAKNQNLSMDWKLGLFFLKWAKNCNLINSIDLHSFIVSRAVYRWINTSYREIDYRYIIISDFPELPHWILGQRSLHPLKLPQLFKLKPTRERELNGIKYCLLKETSDKFFWNLI